MNSVSDSMASRIYRPDIDGLRAIAILGVVFYHAGVPWLSGGFTGVDIFFVISGYLIGGHIYSEIQTERFSFWEFYKRRAKRILPAFYAVLAFTFVAALFLLSSAELTTYAMSAISAVFSTSNIYFSRRIADYFHTSPALNPLLMTWSLGVEEQFYAVIPLLMVVLARIRRTMILPALAAICLVSFFLAWRELGTHPNVAFYLLPARAWELGVGVVLAIAELRWNRRLFSGVWAQAASVAGFVLMLAPVFLLTVATPFPGVAALPSVIGTALVIASPDSWVNRMVFSAAPLVFIGKISYSWYLWHWPLLAIFRVPSGGLLSPRADVAAVILSFVAAVLSYYFVEQPFRRSKRAPLPLLIRYAAVSILFACALGGTRLSHGLPSRFPALRQIEQPASDTCVADFTVDRPNLSPPCFAAHDPRPSVVLWGDSHSGVLASTLRSDANAQGYSLIQVSKSDCLPLRDAALDVPNNPIAARACMRFNESVLKLVVTDPHTRIVVLTGVWSNPFRKESAMRLITLTQDSGPAAAGSTASIFTRSLNDMIQTLQKAGKRVVLVDDVPTFDFDPLMRFETVYIPARRALGSIFDESIISSEYAPAAYASAAHKVTALLAKTQEEFPGVELVELRPRFCDSHDLCVYMANDKPYFRDDNHVTQDGARYALQGFRLPKVN